MQWFVAWVRYYLFGLGGGVNGLFIVFQNIWNKVSEHFTKIDIPRKYLFGRKLMKQLGTFVCIDFAWLFFRADNMQAAMGMLKRIYSNLGNISLLYYEIFDTGISLLQIMFAGTGLLCMFLIDFLHIRGIKIRNILSGCPIVLRWGIYYSLVLGIIVVSIANMGLDSSQFIYGQF